MAHDSNHSTVSEAVARPARGAVQGGLGWIITENIDAFIVDLSERQYGALTALLAVIISFAQNAYENYRGKGLFLRDVPPNNVTLEGS